jgi:hypothetical protein
MAVVAGALGVLAGSRWLTRIIELLITVAILFVLRVPRSTSTGASWTPWTPELVDAASPAPDPAHRQAELVIPFARPDNIFRSVLVWCVTVDRTVTVLAVHVSEWEDDAIGGMGGGG